MATNNISCIQFSNGLYTGGDESRSNYISNPNGFVPSWHDLSSSSSGRSDSGFLINNYTRRNMNKIKLSWEMLPAIELHRLLSSITEDNTVEVTFFSWLTWSDQTFTAYVSADREPEYVCGDSPETSYVSFSMSLIEI